MKEKETMILSIFIEADVERRTKRGLSEPSPTINHRDGHARNTPSCTTRPVVIVATTKQRQQAVERKLRYANSILRGSSIYSFTFTVRPHDNKNKPISRLFSVQHQDNR